MSGPDPKKESKPKKVIRTPTTIPVVGNILTFMFSSIFNTSLNHCQMNEKDSLIPRVTEIASSKHGIKNSMKLIFSTRDYP